MVTPTTASAAEATPELPGTLGMVRTVSATPQVVWRSWSDTGGGLEYLSSTEPRRALPQPGAGRGRPRGPSASRRRSSCASRRPLHLCCFRRLARPRQSGAGCRRRVQAGLPEVDEAGGSGVRAISCSKTACASLRSPSRASRLKGHWRRRRSSGRSCWPPCDGLPRPSGQQCGNHHVTPRCAKDASIPRR